VPSDHPIEKARAVWTGDQVLVEGRDIDQRGGVPDRGVLPIRMRLVRAGHLMAGPASPGLRAHKRRGPGMKRSRFQHERQLRYGPGSPLSNSSRARKVRILNPVIAMKRIVVLVAVALASCDKPHKASAAGDVVDAPVGQFPASAGLVQAISGNDELSAAQAAIGAGHPWRATQTMAPVLRNPSRRTPAAIVVAARAAAGWDGWAEVDKLLAKQPWIDTMFEGEGRELLARSALERGADTLALTHAMA